MNDATPSLGLRRARAVHGVLAGLCFAGLEGGYVLGTGEGVPWTLPAVCAAVYAVAGGLLGLVVSPGSDRADQPRSDARMLAAFVGVGAAALALVAAGSPRARAAGVVAVTIGTVLLYLACARAFRSPLLPNRSPALRAVVVAPATLFVLVLLVDVNLRTVESGDLLMRGAVTLGVASVGVAAVLAIDRLTARLRGGDATAFLAAAILATSAIAVGLALDSGRRASMPALPERDPAAAGDRPHVVLVVLDTARADHMSVYGYSRETTPHLERLARTSMVFAHAQSFDSWTQPSHEVLFTGSYPRAYHRTVPPESRTLAEILAGEGYRTAALVANSAVLHPSFGFDQGFELYDARANCRVRYRPLAFGLLSRVDPLRLHRSIRWYRDADSILDEGRRLLKTAASRDEPLFLFVNLMEPHWPYVPEAPYHDRFEGYRPGVSRIYRDAPWGVWDDLGFTERDRELMVALYDGEIASADAALGRFLASLRREGLLDEALVVVTSDHGELLGEHNFVGHDHGLYQETQHVPLIVRYPGGAPNGRREETVSLADVFGIVLGETGAPEDVWEGTTVARVDTSGAPLRRVEPVLAHHRPSEREVERYAGRFRARIWCAYADNPRLKYCENSRDESWLTNLDPGPRERVAGGVEPTLQAVLAAFRTRTAAGDASAPSALELDREVLEGLRALGYVD